MISLDRTRALIHGCTDQFLNSQSRVADANETADDRETTSHDVTSRLATIHPQHRTTSTVDQKSSDVSGVSIENSLPSLLGPSPSLNEKVQALLPSSPERDLQAKQEICKSIFRDLESYIIRCFSGVDCLNASFTASRPPNPGRAASDSTIPRQAAGAKSKECPEKLNGFPDLDAKTLLLGDFAENGMWWAGVSIF